MWRSQNLIRIGCLVEFTWKLLSSHRGEDRMGLGFPIEERIGWNEEVSKKERI